eukprot:5485636-Alexandrium_andersonii.AAC.1
MQTGTQSSQQRVYSGVFEQSATVKASPFRLVNSVDAEFSGSPPYDDAAPCKRPRRRIRVKSKPPDAEPKDEP